MSVDDDVPGGTASHGAPLPPPPPPSYGPAPSPYGVPVPPRPTNGFAVASFACLMLALGGSIVTCGLTMPIAIPGLVFGHVSLRQIARTGDDGRWMALTGVIAGWILVALVVLLGLSALAIAVLDDGGT